MINDGYKSDPICKFQELKKNKWGAFISEIITPNHTYLFKNFHRWCAFSDLGRQQGFKLANAG